MKENRIDTSKNIQIGIDTRTKSVNSTKKTETIHTYQQKELNTWTNLFMAYKNFHTYLFVLCKAFFSSIQECLLKSLLVDWVNQTAPVDPVTFMFP